MNSLKFTESIEVNCPPAAVFDYTQDYRHRLDWDTFLKQADLLDGARSAGKGVKAWCVAKNGLGMETEYVSFDRPRVTAIRMTKGPFMFKSFLGSWNFKALNENKTAVVFLYSFHLRFPFTLAGRFIKRNLQGNVRQRLADLKMCMEREGKYPSY